MRSAIIAMFISVMLLTACGSAPGGGSQPTATFGPAVQTRLAEASRPRPTRTPVPQATAGSTAEVAPTSTPPPVRPTPAATMTPVPDPADELLMAALLTQENMPEGWTGGERVDLGNSDENWSGDDDMLVPPGSEDYCGALFEDPYLNQVAVLLSSEDDTELVIQFIALYDIEQTADLVLTQTIAATQQCPEYEEVIDGETVITRITQLEYPALGDRSGAYKVTVTDGEYVSEVVVVAYRVNRTMSMIMHVAEPDTAGPAEGWNTQDIVVRALEKIEALREQIDALDRPAPNVV